jgi:hypothetical protein
MELSALLFLHYLNGVSLIEHRGGIRKTQIQQNQGIWPGTRLSRTLYILGVSIPYTVLLFLIPRIQGQGSKEWN